MSEQTAATDSRPRLAKDKLGVISVAFFVFAAAAPIGALVGATPLIFAGAGPGAPLVILLGAILIAIFAVGYLLMARRIRNAGGFVVLVSHGLGREAAGASAGIIVATHTGLSVGLWSLFGLFAEGMFAEWSIPIPALIWAVVGTAVSALLVIRGVSVSMSVLGVLLGFEILCIAVLVVGVLVTTPLDAFASPGVAIDGAIGPGIGIAFLFTFSMFTMFEAPTVFSEEARSPERTIPRALYLVVSVIAVLYAVSTWAISAAVGNDRIAQVAAENPEGFIYGLAATVIGEWFASLLHILVVVSFFAMMIAVQNVFSRYLFSLGRAGLISSRFSHVNRREAPLSAAILVAVIIAVLLAVFMLSGVDPFTLYSWMLGVGTAGFIVVLTIASVAVIVYFRRNGSNNVLGTVVCPVIAGLGTLGVLYLVLSNYEYVGGTGIAAWLLLLSIPILAAVGAWLASRRPRVDFSDVVEG
ncbi:MAG: APC family permease [Leucobacter sp.]